MTAQSSGPWCSRMGLRRPTLSSSCCSCCASCCWMLLHGTRFGFGGHPPCPSSSVQCCSAQFRPRSRLPTAWCQSSAPLCGTTCCFILWLATWKGPLSVKPQELRAPCQAPLPPQRPRHQRAPLLLCPEEDPLCGAWETEEKRACHTTTRTNTSSWLGPLPCCLSPSVGLFSVFNPAEEVGELGPDGHILHQHLPCVCAVVGAARLPGPFVRGQVLENERVCVGDTAEPRPLPTDHDGNTSPVNWPQNNDHSGVLWNVSEKSQDWAFNMYY